MSLAASAFIVSPLRADTLAPGQGPWPGEPTSGSYSFRRIMRDTASTMAAPSGDPGAPLAAVGGRSRCLPSPYIRN